VLHSGSRLGLRGAPKNLGALKKNVIDLCAKEHAQRSMGNGSQMFGPVR